MSEEYKVKLPLITDEELLEIDKNWKYLIDKYLMMTLKEKDQLIAQYVMGKQKQEIQRLNNIIKDIKSQLDYLETYSSKEDVFEDMKRRLDRIENIVNRK